MSSSVLKFSSSNKTKLHGLIDDLEKLDWEEGEYYFQNFIDYYQLPQVIRVKQKCTTDLIENRLMYLQTLFDRYLIVASALTKTTRSSKGKYLISDWFQGECRILSKNPTLKQRWWVFQGAFELYRFGLPRRVKILSPTPAHLRSTASASTHQWDKIVLCKNTHLDVVRREQYQSRVKRQQGELFVSAPKEAFILQDPQTKDEFIVPQGVPLRFATTIEEDELHGQYRNHDGTFTFPELIMRYEFPMDIEILTHLPVDLPDFKAQVRLEKLCVGKSILAYSIDKQQTSFVELSPLSQFTLQCAKCLTFGLPQEGGQVDQGKFDEKAYQRYEDIRSQLKMMLDERSDLYRSKIQVCSNEEVECVEEAFQMSMKMRTQGEKPATTSYVTMADIAQVLVEQDKKEILVPKAQPKRFTVYPSADPSNPYNEVIDYEDMDVLNRTFDQSLSGLGKDEAAESASPAKRSSSAKRRQDSRPALVVQQLPPPMMLPPEIFIKTIKAIPETLYTELLPATVIKKSDRTDTQKKSPPEQTTQ